MKTGKEITSALPDCHSDPWHGMAGPCDGGGSSCLVYGRQKMRERRDGNSQDTKIVSFCNPPRKMMVKWQ
jgi:hypothetical protein